MRPASGSSNFIHNSILLSAVIREREEDADEIRALPPVGPDGNIIPSHPAMRV
jgi:hypothetical protein